MVHHNSHLALIAALVTAVVLSACTLNRPAFPQEKVASADASPALVVTYVERGDLMVWRSGDDEPRRIATGGVVQPVLSPNGEHVTFTRGPVGAPETLWVMDTLGVAEQELVGRGSLRRFTPGTNTRIGQVEWLNDHVLYFNTLQGGDVPRPNNDLYRANVRTREVALILPRGEGGSFSISPDAERIAVAYAGTTGRRDGVVRVLDPLAMDVRAPLYFIGHALADGQPYYPQFDWLADSSGVHFATLEVNQLNDGVGGVPGVLWNISAGAQRDSLGNLRVNATSLPRWSSSGDYLAYLLQTADDTVNLVVADGVGGSAEVYAAGSPGTFQAPVWLPEVTRFGYGHAISGTYWLGEPGVQPVRFPNNRERVFTVDFAGEWGVFASAASGVFELRVASVNAAGERSETITRVENAAPIFDAVSLP